MSGGATVMVSTTDVLAGLQRALNAALTGRPDDPDGVAVPDVRVLTCEPDDPYTGDYPYLVLVNTRRSLTRELTEAGRGNAPGRLDAYAFEYFQEPSSLVGSTKAAMQRQMLRDADDILRAFAHDTDPLAGGPSDLWGLVLWAGEQIDVAHLRDYAIKAGQVVLTTTGVIYVWKQWSD